MVREVLKSNSTIPRDKVHQRFMERIGQADENLYDGSRSEDRSLNAAWNFCDDYFDAVVHGFRDCGGIPMAQARIYLEELVTIFEDGGEVQNPEILRFFRNVDRRNPS